MYNNILNGYFKRKLVFKNINTQHRPAKIEHVTRYRGSF